MNFVMRGFGLYNLMTTMYIMLTHGLARDDRSQSARKRDSAQELPGVNERLPRLR